MSITIYGLVKHGKKEASKIGFSTLNIHCPKNIISTGIFYGITEIEKTIYNSVIYIGQNRTDENGDYQCVEVHLIDIHNVNFYDKLCTVKIFEKIRNDKQFNNSIELINEINLDMQKCRNFFLSGIVR